MKCEVCGCENKENALFCAECGKALKEAPIALDLQEIKVPASSRKPRIVKVNTKKGDVKQAETTEAPEEQVVLFNPEKAAVAEADDEAKKAQQAAETETPTVEPAEESTEESAEEAAEESAFIPLQGTPAAAPEAETQNDPTLAPMRIKNWIPVFILSAIPLVNLIMMFVWSFSSRTNKSKQSFARLSLIVALICVVVAVIAAILMKTVFQVNFTSLLQGIKA